MDWQLTGKIIWILFMVAWIAIRWVPHRRSRRTEIKTTVRTLRERFSMVMSATGMGIIPAIWVFTGFFESFDYQPTPLIIIVGALISIFALYLFRKTHKALGAMWAFSLDVRECHKLVTEGIYKRVRHPMYSAFWLWTIAQAMLLSNLMAGFSSVVGFGTLYFMRVGQEEAMMRQEFGEEYDSYVATTGRIIPKL